MKQMILDVSAQWYDYVKSSKKVDPTNPTDKIVRQLLRNKLAE